MTKHVFCSSFGPFDSAIQWIAGTNSFWFLKPMNVNVKYLMKISVKSHLDKVTSATKKKKNP
jgi:hypothetical protein